MFGFFYMFLKFLISYHRCSCAGDSSMCHQLPAGDRAPGHRVCYSLFPDLGCNHGTLWGTDVGRDLSNQTLLQQPVVLDKMVRNICGMQCISTRQQQRFFLFLVAFLILENIFLLPQEEILSTTTCILTSALCVHSIYTHS